jgi:hypothetical protein
MGTASLSILDASKNSNANFLMDLDDEVAGYKRQGMFGSDEGIKSIEQLNADSRYKHHAKTDTHSGNYKPFNKAKEVGTDALKTIAVGLNAAYRINIGGKRITFTP